MVPDTTSRVKRDSRKEDVAKQVEAKLYQIQHFY